MGRSITRRRGPRLCRIQNGIPGEAIFEGRLHNGLTVIVSQRRGYAKRFAIIAARYGSVDNTFADPETGERVRVPDGIAHFLEHQLFAQESGDAFDEFSRNGASANAATSFTTTSYVFSCTDQFEKNLRLLLRFVGTPYFTEKNVAKEKGIIGQEIKMYEDNSDWRVFMNLMAALYHRHPIRIDIAGTVESISNITPSALLRCYRTFYHPANMALFVVGDVDPEAVADLAGDVGEKTARNGRGAGAPSGANGAAIERFLPEEPALPARRHVSQSLLVSQPKVAIGFKDAEPFPPGRLLVRREITTHLLLDAVMGKSSALYSRLYEKGIIDDSFSSAYSTDSGYGFTIVAGETKDPARFVRELRAGMARAAREGISDEDFSRIRRKAIGKFVRQFNSPESLAYALLSYHFRGSSLFDYYRELRRVTKAELAARLAEHLSPRQSAVSVILPKRGASA
jgi:predicted Zn-dependent peptidase